MTERAAYLSWHNGKANITLLLEQRKLSKIFTDVQENENVDTFKIWLSKSRTK
jgi:hypothetical protein